ncbi:MAG: fructosamine kinase family protein [Pseudomonadota bacterium]|jgi:Fructosamine-3-kinase|nr:MAG: hypothetical protein DIU56_15690 [Pseudomonadota bacterium]
MPVRNEFRNVADALSAAIGASCDERPASAVGGGSISACYRWESADGPLFVKIGTRNESSMLEAEAEGLRALGAAGAIRVPRVLAVGSTDSASFLALEWIDSGPATAATESHLGEQLATLHRVTADAFGWHRDNTIGRTPQANGWMSDWTEFYAARRLRPQLELAIRNGYGSLLEAPCERLIERLPALLGEHRPVPSLLHGDLWGGNWFADRSGMPVVFDPATYYGDRETDIAMTQLFGGFGREFYAAYRASWPLPPGHEVRRALYDLYHLLNHANLFGGGYARRAADTIRRLLAETGA